MKKLMILAAIAMAGVASNAASITWKWTSTLYDHPNGDSAYAGKVYVINANSYTQQQVLDAILAGGDLATYGMDSYTTANGKGPSSPYPVIASDSKTFTPVRTDGEDKFVDYYYAALTTDGEGNDFIFLGEKKSVAVLGDADTVLGYSLSSSKKTIDGKTFGDQGWYSASAVPEPTSGLLLLLGVAGLALRRRRA